MRTRYRTKIESLDEIRAVLPNADLTPHPEAGPATPQQLYLLSQNPIACEHPRLSSRDAPADRCHMEEGGLVCASSNHRAGTIGS